MTNMTSNNPDLAATVYHSGGSYPVVAGWGVMDRLGDWLEDLGIGSPVYIITDENLMNRYGRRAQRALQRKGIAAHCFIIPPGEPSKTNSLAQAIYEWLVGLRAERGHAILAVGGGVVGDLAGYVAATFLRGRPLRPGAHQHGRHGGRVHRRQGGGEPAPGQEPGGRPSTSPRRCWPTWKPCPPLGKRELSEGWAEAIKHGFIMDANLVDVFEEHAEALMDVEPEISTEVIRRSMAIKAEVVSQDERETLDIRILLNYGHTIGHALEASTEYGRFLHGEGVSIGMMGAAKMACELGFHGQDVVDRQYELLQPVQPAHHRGGRGRGRHPPRHVPGQEGCRGRQPLDNAGRRRPSLSPPQRASGAGGQDG